MEMNRRTFLQGSALIAGTAMVGGAAAPEIAQEVDPVRGNSIAVDPWGTVLCRAGAEETTLYADLDFARLEAVRQQLPILSARRTDLYEVREK